MSIGMIKGAFDDKPAHSAIRADIPEDGGRFGRRATPQ